MSGAYTIGKTPTTNEDALFITERAFGVADGVSGWTDFGFSSDAFSNELMRFCKEEIIAFDQNRQQRAQHKAMSKNMRKTGSFMSFEMLEETSLQVVDGARSGSFTHREKATVTVRASDSSNAGSVQSSESKRLHKLDTVYVLEQAYSKVKSAGSSTAVIGILQPDNCLLISNLGDSGFIHYRQRECKTTFTPGGQT